MRRAPAILATCLCAWAEPAWAQPKIEVLQHDLDFGTEWVGGGSKPQALTINNTGDTDLTIQGIDTSGNYPNDFWIAGNLFFPLVIPPGTAAVTSVSFHPTAEGLLSASVDVKSNDPQRAVVHVSVAGRAVADGISCEARDVAFGPQTVNRRSASVSITIRNAAEIDAQILDVKFTGPEADWFEVWPPVAYPVVVPAANGTTFLGVTVTPKALASGAATLIIVTNVGNAPIELPVTVFGTSGRIAAPLAPTDFGLVVARSTRVHTVAIMNVGAATLDLDGIAVDGLDSRAFGVRPAGPLAIAPGQSVDLVVSFTPDHDGAFGASLTLRSDDLTAPTTIVKLKGAGVVGQPLSLWPDRLDFPRNTTRLESAPQTIGIKNRGAASLPLKSILLVGTDSRDFRLVGPVPTSIDADATVNVSVVYSPFWDGKHVASLQIATQDFLPLEAFLTGSALAPGAASADGSGGGACGCRLAARPRAPSAWPLACLLALVARRRFARRL